MSEKEVDTSNELRVLSLFSGCPFFSLEKRDIPAHTDFRIIGKASEMLGETSRAVRS